MFFRAEALKQIKGFDESFIRHQDIEVLVRFFEKSKIINVDEVLVLKDEDDRENVPDVEKFINTKKQYIKSFEKYINNMQPIEKEEFYYRNYLEVLYLIIKKKDYKCYKRIYKKIEEYRKINRREKIKLCKLFILSYIDLHKLKREKMKKQYEKVLEKEIVEEVNFYENLI